MEAARLYIIAHPIGDGYEVSVMDEEGYVPTKLWVKHHIHILHAIGYHGKKCHKQYNEDYPDGWKLINLADCTPEELLELDWYVTAIQKNKEHVETPAKLDSGVSDVHSGE